MNTNQSVMSPEHCNVAGPFSNELFTMYSASDFPGLPEMSWRIDDILPSSGVACVYGPSGVGKSFFCLDMVASVATGQPWFGHKSVQTGAVYIVLEGQAGFRRRVAAWEAYREEPFPENVKFVFDPFELNNSNHVTNMGNLIKQCSEAGLIIVDTLSRAAPGMDENTSHDMGKVIDGAFALQKLTGGLVILIHHPGKDGSRGMRGHSSLQGALDTIIEVQKDGELVRWKFNKSKESEGDISHAFRLLSVELGVDQSGKAIKSCVIQEAEGAATVTKNNLPPGANQKVLLNAAREILKQRQVDFVTDISDTPEGMAFDDLLGALKDVLADVPPKHRKLRTTEALERLCEMGYLASSGGLVCLPANN